MTIDFSTPLKSASLDDRSLQDHQVVDSLKRIEFGTSRWKRITHFFEKRALDKKVEAGVRELFYNRYGFDDQLVFSKIWSCICTKDWSLDCPITLGKLREIDNQFRTRLIYHGPGQPMPEMALDVDKRVFEIVSILLHGGKATRLLIDKEIARAVFVKHDPKFMAAFLKEIQHEFDHLLANPPKTENEAVIWRAFHGNLISLLPYAYPHQGDTIRIPFLNSDLACSNIAYQVEILPLELTGHSTPMSALGLTPQFEDAEREDDIPIYLSFIGTTFPAGSGFAATILADFTPGHSVGEAVFDRNKEKLDDWMKGKKNIHALGMSLGGAMALHLLKHCSQDLAQVDVFVPAGLYPTAWARPISDTCKVNIYCQKGDLVSMLGSFPKGENVKMYRVYAHQDTIKKSVFGSHVKVFTGCKKVTFLKLDPAEENASFARKFLTKMHQFLGPVLVFVPARLSLFFYHLSRKVRAAVSRVFSKT